MDIIHELIEQYKKHEDNPTELRDLNKVCTYLISNYLVPYCKFESHKNSNGFEVFYDTYDKASLKEFQKSIRNYNKEFNFRFELDTLFFLHYCIISGEKVG